MNLRCSLHIHAFSEKDEHGRITCHRCGKRKPVVFAAIPDPELAGRQLARRKTRGRLRQGRLDPPRKSYQ